MLQVWSIRADLHVLNHDGNLIDACSMAAIAALAHFRRPDVTVSGEDVTIVSTGESLYKEVTQKSIIIKDRT